MFPPGTYVGVGLLIVDEAEVVLQSACDGLFQAELQRAACCHPMGRAAEIWIKVLGGPRARVSRPARRVDGPGSIDRFEVGSSAGLGRRLAEDACIRDQCKSDSHGPRQEPPCSKIDCLHLLLPVQKGIN